MEPRKARSRRSGPPGRRKVALACEPCRTRKSRCDGSKPICGPCERRGHSIEQCLYKTENARSASQDEYIRILHNRIRELEKACVKGGLAVPALGSGENASVPKAEGQQARSPMQASQTRDSALDMSLGSPPPDSRAQSGVPQLGPNTGCVVNNRCETSQVASENQPNHKCSSLAQTHDGHACSQLDPGSNVTAMGAISTVDDSEASASPQDEYFGSSSSASLMRLLVRGKALVHRPGISTRTSNPYMEEDSLPPRSHNRWGAYSRCQLEGSVLPMRAFADHLLECFWERVYCLYPFFDRQSFEDAYENLWSPVNQPARQLSELNIGIGSKIDSGPDSLVFNCALNMVFALGCHFADLSIPDREALSYTFFIRSKQFVGLDFLEVRSIGVVQALLTTALYLQSTPYPDLCWNAIGIACRVAQGFGLHAVQLYETKSLLEQKIQRQTWHGCVIMDMIVSMTYGRPSMTSHLPDIPLPGAFDSIRLQRDTNQDPSLMTFFIETIRLYKILDVILSDVYHTWQGRSNHACCPTSAAKQGGLDILITIEKQLHEYEANLPLILSWTGNSTPTAVGESLILKRQRNVLHARFLYLHLLLYRPTFTYICSEEASYQTSQGRSGNDTPGNRGSLRNSTLYSTISSKCAVECVKSAVDLVSLVYDTYHTSVTDTWWYNGFYTSTAAMVFIMSYSCRSVQKQLDEGLIDQAWSKCEKILSNMAAFSQSARNTLRFLRAAHAQTISNSAASEETEGQDSTCHTESNNTRPSTVDLENPGENAMFPGQEQVPLAGPFFTWGDAVDAGVAPDELGFLGPFDFTDVSSWFPDIAA